MYRPSISFQARLLPATLLLAVSALLPPAASSHTDPALTAMMNKMMHGPSMRKLQNSSARAFEAAFLTEMIEHHRGGIEMSRMTVKGADRAEVRQAAQKVIRDQTEEIGQMTGMLKSWYRRNPDPKLRAQVRSENAPMMRKFNADCKKDCDMAFLMHMKVHHQMGVHMAQMAVKKAVHPELRRLAQHIIHAQSAEAKRFETLLHPTTPAPTPKATHSDGHAGHNH
jgi:uncharacterized protein (DUF305 family)